MGRSCGLLGASWAPGLLGRASTRINSLIRVSWTPVISSRAPLELVRERGRSCGLLGDVLGSRAPGEDFKGAGGSRGHTGISRLPRLRGGSLGPQHSPSTTSGRRGAHSSENQESGNRRTPRLTGPSFCTCCKTLVLCAGVMHSTKILILLFPRRPRQRASLAARRSPSPFRSAPHAIRHGQVQNQTPQETITKRPA